MLKCREKHFVKVIYVKTGEKLTQLERLSNILSMINDNRSKKSQIMFNVDFSFTFSTRFLSHINELEFACLRI